VISPDRAAPPGSGPSAPTHRRPLALPIVCLITDRTLVGMQSLDQVVAAAVAGGVTMVQLREKDLPTRALLDLATRLRAVVEPNASLIVNGRADVAFAAGASGVHLPSDGLPTEGARSALGASLIVGRSVHSGAETVEHNEEQLDYVELGTIFPSRSHPGGQVVGLDEIAAARQVGIPIVAVGGITPENAADVIRAGADGVAVISAILAAPDPESAARRLAVAVRDAWLASRPRDAALTPRSAGARQASPVRAGRGSGE